MSNFDGVSRRELISIAIAAAASAKAGASGVNRRVDPPAATANCGMPFFATGPDGTVYLAWTETLGEKRFALRFSRWPATGGENGWSAPETVVEGRNWFANWADFASISVLQDGSMLAHWLQRAEGSGRFGYGIRISRRDPQRAVWREVHGICLDEPVDYAGFFTFAPGSGGAAYLAPPVDAPRQAPPQAGHNHEDDHGHRKTARFVSFRPDGAVEFDREIDSDACSCCQTAAGRTRDGWLVAYRDHSADETRDISVIRYSGGVWSEPKALHKDGWKINACPTDGPSMAVMEGRENVAIAWLTRAGDSPKVQIAFSGDQGASFGRAPVRVDDGNPLGRPNVVALDRSRVLVVWLEKTGSNTSMEIRMRVVHKSGSAGSSAVVAEVPVGRNSGFPKVAIAGRDILVAWKDGGVRTALVPASKL